MVGDAGDMFEPWTQGMFDDFYVASLAVSAIFVTSALNVCYFTSSSSVPAAWPLRRQLSLLLIASCLIRSAEFALRNRAILCAHDHHGGEDKKRQDLILRTLVVALQGSGSATSLAALSLLTLFFEEVRRSVRIVEPKSRTRSVAGLRAVVTGVILVFGILSILTALAVPFEDPLSIDRRAMRPHTPQEDCIFWLMQTWQPDAYYLLQLLSRVLAAAFFLGTVSSSVRHACAQPNSWLKLRWVCALICVGLSTVGRACADVYLVLWSVSEPEAVLTFSHGLQTLIAYFVGLEALPSAIVLVALGEQVSATSFNRFGTVPWALRLDFRQLTFGSFLGEGAFGMVYAASLYGKLVAVKRLRLPASLPDAEMQRLTNALELALECEATLLSQLDHPNVVKFLGLAFEERACDETPRRIVGSAPAIVTELLPLGSLHSLLYGRTTSATLPWERRLVLAQQLAAGVAYLHSRSPPVMHRDLKPENCLLDADGTLKITDLGLSRLLAHAAPPATEGEVSADSVHELPGVANSLRSSCSLSAASAWAGWATLSLKSSRTPAVAPAAPQRVEISRGPP